MRVIADVVQDSITSVVQDSKTSCQLSGQGTTTPKRKQMGWLVQRNIQKCHAMASSNKCNDCHRSNLVKQQFGSNRFVVHPLAHSSNLLLGKGSLKPDRFNIMSPLEFPLPSELQAVTPRDSARYRAIFSTDIGLKISGGGILVRPQAAAWVEGEGLHRNSVFQRDNFYHLLPLCPPKKKVKK